MIIDIENDYVVHGDHHMYLQMLWYQTYPEFRLWSDSEYEAKWLKFEDEFWEAMHKKGLVASSAPIRMIPVSTPYRVGKNHATLGTKFYPEGQPNNAYRGRYAAGYLAGGAKAYCNDAQALFERNKEAAKAMADDVGD